MVGVRKHQPWHISVNSILVVTVSNQCSSVAKKHAFFVSLLLNYICVVVEEKYQLQRNMSILQNFKDTDHSFEKKFFFVILCMAFSIGLFFLIDMIFDKIPDVKNMFLSNIKIFRCFFFSSIGGLVFSYLTYISTLDFWEAETEATVKSSIISVVIWIIIWISWSIFCAWLTLTFNPMTRLVKLTIIGLVIIPGLTGFLFSRNIRQQQLREQEEHMKSISAGNFNSEPYIICIDRKYYSGYYGLLCLPVYLVSLLIAQFL